MSEEQEWKIRLQFLDEARDYLDEIESELIGMSDRGFQRQSMDKVLRAAHSVKGGAAMMGFDHLSDSAHRLEDSFKALRGTTPDLITPEVEGLFLKAIDSMGQLAIKHKQRTAIATDWLDENAIPPFTRLTELLGEYSSQDETAALSAEAGQDMRTIMFESEVDACLLRLEGVLADQNTKVLREEFAIASQELGCLGEILDLPPFITLCEGITEKLETAKEDLQQVATAALEVWRKSQALVLVGQFALIPAKFEISPILNLDLSEQTVKKISVAKAEVTEIEVTEIEVTEAEVSEAQRVEVQFQAIAPQVSLPELEPEPEADEATVRIPMRYLKNLGDLIGGLNAERNGMRSQLKRMRELTELLSLRVNGLEQSNTQLREAYDRVETIPLVASGIKSGVKILGINSTNEPASTFTQKFDLLEMDRYGEMHILSREIMDSVVQLQEVSTDIDTALSDTESTERELGRATIQIQNAIAQARMRLLDDILSRFPRMLRELSLSHGKQVELVVSGSSTLVERSVLDVLEAPLLHLVRNAFDHGIEDANTRIARGKSPKGRLEISAGYRGNQTVITVRDDGGGIDVNRIRVKALEMGLSPNELDRASESELLDLIFEAGFSTANQVTALSGRGVGMDVVRSNLISLGGNITVETELGKGTAFILSVPMSLSITRVLLVESNGLIMAIPTSAIEEMLLFSALEIKTNTEPETPLETFDWEGYSVPLLRLRDRLNFNRAQSQVESITSPIIDEPLVLVVAPNNLPFAIQVDRYWGEQEVTTRTIQSHFPLPVGFAGCATLGGGRIVPMMDLDKLMDWATSPDSAPSQPKTLAMAKRDRRTTIMVVDDSINVRRFLAMTLEKAGFRVEQAKDGQDAIEKLLTGTPVRAVVCDIEMPRLDGFGFLAQSRADQNCKDIPVIMLTSRSGIKHRELAMRLGASAYFAKPFKEQELLHTLSQLTNISTSTTGS